MMLLGLTVNTDLVIGLDRAGQHGMAAIVGYAIRHYAVTTNRFPETAAANAANMIAANARQGQAHVLRWGCTHTCGRRAMP